MYHIWSVKTSSCVSILVHLTVPSVFFPVKPLNSICCRLSQHPLICWHQILCSTTTPLIWLGNFLRINYTTSLFKHLSMWYWDIVPLCSFANMIWWSNMYSLAHFVHLCIHFGYELYFINKHDLLLLSMGMSASDMSFISDSFHRYLMGWNLIISS